ncbi:AIPR family protein [Nonlabens ulvanivorans]|uniref:AIPR family protein n=2 Tax=Nonlabens ulvanivorans TaxID=906888 RepID=UPI0032661603
MNCELFINSYLDKISKKFNINRDDAFEVFSISAILDRSFDEVFDNILIKGSEDGGIDGIFFSEDYGNYTMHIFQCKNSNKFGQNQIEKFRNDFREIFFNGNKSNKLHISGLNKSIERFKHIITSGKMIDSKQYFVYNGKLNDPKYTSNKLLTENFHVDDEFEIWDSNDLYQKIKRLVTSLNKRKQINFVFKPENSNITSKKDNQGLISFSIYQVKAAIFRIPAKQLCELLDLEKSTNDTFEKIFAENIRGFLGKKNLTNEKILETINSDKNVYFPFLNNGITIICNEFTLPYNPQLGSYNLPTKNPVIVNGLQTTYILYQEYLKDQNILEDVYITIRLYETEDPEIVELITDATNTQSAIGFRDKISNKKFNIYAKELFENKGIGYITKRGEVFTNTSDTITKTIHNTSLIPLWYSAFFESPHIALSAPKIMYKEIFQATNKSDHPLNEILKGDIDSPFYSQLFFVYSLIEIFKLEYKKSQDSVDSNFSLKFNNLSNIGEEYIVYLLYKLIDDELDSNFNIISNKVIYDSIYELIEIISETDYDPSKFSNKGSFINSILYSDYRIGNIRELQSQFKRTDNYLELFDDYKSQSDIVEKIKDTKINLENININ